MTLGEYLNQTRNERGYTLRDLSARCGVSSAEISRIESGKRKKPAPTVLNSLAGALVLDYTYLLELAGYMPESRQPDQGRKEEKLTLVLTGPDGMLKDLQSCAEQMYETDREWLQTAYLVSQELSEKDRNLIHSVVKMLLDRCRKP